MEKEEKDKLRLLDLLTIVRRPRSKRIVNL